MTTYKKLNQIIFTISSVLAILSLAACASKPAPVTEISPDEPIVVASEEVNDAPTEQINEPYEPVAEQYNEPYDPAASEPVMEEAASDMAFTEESSGIAPPDEESAMMEPPAEMMDEPMATDTAMETTASSISETPADYYGIQIVAASSMENMQAFANKHGISNQLSTKIMVDGKEWYVLLQGTYPTLEEAKSALSGIQGQYTTSPWIRRIGSLQ